MCFTEWGFEECVRVTSFMSWVAGGRCVVGLNVKTCWDSIGVARVNFISSTRHGPPALSLENWLWSELFSQKGEQTDSPKPRNQLTACSTISTTGSRSKLESTVPQTTAEIAVKYQITWELKRGSFCVCRCRPRPHTETTTLHYNSNSRGSLTELHIRDGQNWC